jgi:hypothetical protein
MTIKMTTSQKFEYKAEGYGKQWDPTTSITAYFTGLDKFWTSLIDHGIATSVEKTMMTAGARMWESKMFTEDQMVAWENKTAAQQTWKNLQDYFTEKWLEWRQYSHAIAKTFMFQGCCTCCTRISCSRGRRQDHHNNIHSPSSKSNIRHSSSQWQQPINW